jgi:hypothetical protein
MQLNNDKTYNKNDCIEEENNKTIEIKQYFINHEKYQLLRLYQQCIFEATEISPTIRKIVNEIICVENLEKIKEKFLAILK